MDNSRQNSSRGEWIRFGILVLVMLGAIVVVALSRPFVANRVVPAFLGSSESHQVSLPIMEDSGSEVDGEGETHMDDGAEGEQGEASGEEGETAVSDPNAEEAPATDQTGAGTSATEPPADSGNTVTHIIQAGESLFVLAQRYNVTVQQIVDANNITNPNRIAVGDELIIPQP